MLFYTSMIKTKTRLKRESYICTMFGHLDCIKICTIFTSYECMATDNTSKITLHLKMNFGENMVEFEKKIFCNLELFSFCYNTCTLHISNKISSFFSLSRQNFNLQTNSPNIHNNPREYPANLKEITES